MNEEILPEYKEAYDKIPVSKMGEGHSVSKEAFIATGAGFCFLGGTINFRGSTALEELEKEE